MGRYSFHEGVWFNGLAAVLAGAGGVGAVTVANQLGLAVSCASVVLGVGLIVWGFKIDGEHWWKRSRGKVSTADPVAWQKGRTRFTLKEAACVIAGVHPSDFSKSALAQGEAAELLHYARLGLVRPAGMRDLQYETLKRGAHVDGFEPEAMTIDNVLISTRELDTYRKPGFKTWLPVLEDVTRR